MKDGSSEYGLFVCFKSGMIAHNGLETKDRLGNPDFPVPIMFIYGDRDWVYYSGVVNVVKQNSNFFNNLKLNKVVTLVNSDHHLYFDAPS